MDFHTHTHTACSATMILGIIPVAIFRLSFGNFLSLPLAFLPCIPHMTFAFLLLFSQVLGLMDEPCISSLPSLSTPFPLHSASHSLSTPPPSFFPNCWHSMEIPNGFPSPSVSLTSSLLFHLSFSFHCSFSFPSTGSFFPFLTCFLSLVVDIVGLALMDHPQISASSPHSLFPHLPPP